MSDDFKKQPPNQPPDDDDSLDWLRSASDEGDQPAGGSGTGLTGKLQWQQSGPSSDEPGDQADDDLFDWQQAAPGQPSTSGGSGLGFTGELDWKKVSGETASSGDSADDDSLDWLKSIDDVSTAPTAIPPSRAAEPSPSAAADDPLAWMKDFGIEAEEAAAAPVEEEDEGTTPLADENDPLGWMKAFDVHVAQTSQLDPRRAPNADPDADDPLSWLSGLPETPAPAAPAQPVANPDAAADEDPLAWMKDFQIDSPEEVPADAVPDWLQGAEEPAPASGDDLPPWLAGAEAPAAPPTDDELLGGLDEALGLSAPPQPMGAPVPAEELSLDWMLEPDAVEPEAPVPAAAEVPGTTQFEADLDLPDWWDDVGSEPGVDLGPLGAGDAAAEAEEALANVVPDWLAASAPPPPDDEEPSGDIFAQLGLPAVETGFDFLDEKPAPADERTDWFSGEEEAKPADSRGTPDWLASLGDVVEQPEPEIPLPADDDFLADLRADQAPAAAADEFEMPDFDSLAAPSLDDIDKLLASYEASAPLPAASISASTDDADLDQLLSDSELQQINTLRSPERSGLPEGLSPDAPDWLTELGATAGSVGGASAAAILRKQADQERPAEELSDRLYALHEAGLEIAAPEESTASPVIANLLPGVKDMIPPTPLRPGLPGITGDFALEESQQRKLDILKALVAIEDEKPQNRPSAIDLTLTTPNLSDFAAEDDDEAPEPGKAAAGAAAAAPFKVSRPRYKVDRLLIALLLAAAVVLPFLLPPLRLGELPPADFAAGGPAAAAYDQVAALKAGQVALVSIEYGPGAAGELDPALDALLRHILLRGARPALIGGNPVGLLHAQNVLERITTDPGFRARLGRDELLPNRDYYILRYLPGSALGLRTFAQNVAQWALTDINGQPTGLRVSGLADFALITAVVERAEDARIWAEQIGLLAALPPVLAVGQSAAPLVQPYAVPGGSLGGLVVGYRDAFTYQSVLETSSGSSVITVTEETPPPQITSTPPPETPAPTGVPAENLTPTAADAAATVVPTEVLAETATPAQDSAPAEATATSLSTEVPTDVPTATAVPTEAPTLPPTATAAPTEVPTDVPTATAVPTEAPTLPPTATTPPAVTATLGEPAGTVRVFAIVDADDLVRVREGAGRSFPAIETLQPGQRVQVIGRTGDSSWIQVRLDDGREGWVSASLLRLETPATPTQSARRIDPFAVVGLESDVFLLPPLQEATAEVTAEATVEATVDVTEEATATTAAPTPPPAPTPVPAPRAGVPYLEERWYGMTLGLIVVIVIIALGAVINILRALFRRSS